MKTVDILKKLGETIKECRKVPRNFFDTYGREIDKEKKPWNRSFYKLNEHPEGSSCLIEAEKENYQILARVLMRTYDPPKTTSCDSKPILLAAYSFWRTNVGCLGENITRLTCSNVSDIKERLDLGLGEEILEIGRNEHFNPKIERREKRKGGIVVGEADSRMKIVPALPREDAEELSKRFSGLLQYYKEKTGTVS